MAFIVRLSSPCHVMDEDLFHFAVQTPEAIERMIKSLKDATLMQSPEGLFQTFHVKVALSSMRGRLALSLFRHL